MSLNKKLMKNYNQFVNESFFHTEKQINDILDKIAKIGYNNISDSDKSILNNYSKDDKDIHNILLEMRKITNKFREINAEIDAAFKRNASDHELDKLKNKWMSYHYEMSKYENLLRYVYKIKDPIKLWQYEEKFL